MFHYTAQIKMVFPIGFLQYVTKVYSNCKVEFMKDSQTMHMTNSV